MNDYTYDDWTELLGGFFFDEAHDGDEILFAVDELSLAEASGLAEQEARASLADAVRLVIGEGWNVGAVKRLVERWRGEGNESDHPALPFLALTVLAASRMGAYEGFAAHKFYVPLRCALVADDSDVDAPGTYLAHVRWLWDDLAAWANDDLDGRRGRLTIRDPGIHYGRGLAMQHALVKSYDLRQLDAFFRRIGLQPGEEVAPAELRRALAVWTAGRTEPWAERLHRVTAEPDLVDYAEALLAREARRWDGRSRDPRTGRAVGRVRLGIQSIRRPTIGLYVEWDDRLPESVKVAMPSGQLLELTRAHGWYEPHPLEDLDLAEALSGGLELRGDGNRFDLRAEDAYAVSYDDDLGAWTSVDCMSFGDRYHLLVRQEVVTEVLGFVQEESTIESRLDEVASRSLLPGWKLIANVRIDARPKTNPPASLGALVPAGAGPRLRLLGGLPLKAAHGIYLRGGEPALALSTLTEDDRISITRESTGQVERFRVSVSVSREVPLWQLQLEPDRYEIVHGESKVALQIVDGIAEAAGPGAGSVRHRGLGSEEVLGTTTTRHSRERSPITAPAPAPGNALVVLGARADEHKLVELPTWLSSLVGFELSWTKIDAWPEFDPVWLLVRGALGRFEASLYRAIEPNAAEGAASTQWGRMIAVAQLRNGESDQAAELWSRYQTAAGGVR